MTDAFKFNTIPKMPIRIQTNQFNLQRQLMNITAIPFVEKVGITRHSSGLLELPFNSGLHNHLQTIHASAQFALAETASGDFLQTQFPQLVGKVVPVLRDAQVKFKKPAIKTIRAATSVSNDTLQAFNDRFSQKDRASIVIDVEIKDADDTVTCVASFNWFIQRIDDTRISD